MRPAGFLYLSCAVHGAAMTAALGFSAYAGSRAALAPPQVLIEPSTASAPSAAAALPTPDVVVEAVIDEPLADVREVVEAASEFAPPVAEATAPDAEAQPTLHRIAATPPQEPTPTAADAAAAAAAPAPLQSFVAAVERADNERPQYPPAELQSRREDTVVLALTIDDRGDVLAAALHAPSRYAGFNREALRVARRWRFEPARRDGVAVATTHVVRVEFRVDDARPAR